MKEKIKEILKKVVLFILNPRLLLCVGIAWMITNGWSYVLFGIGTLFEIGWMIAVSSTYMALLWFPFTPEKILTMIIAIFLLKLLFPKDERTLGILLDLHKMVVEKFKIRREKKRKRKEEKDK